MNIKIQVSWLREYLKTDVAAKTLANYLSLSGPSVEKIEKKGSDYIFDIEITSNRFDAASVFGLAREAYAILSSQNQKVTLSSPFGSGLNLLPERKNPLPLDVVITSSSLCPRFAAIVVENVKVKPSPAIIKNRLEASGIRSINNIVDISNYLMLELGQPMHTFDYDRLKGAKMILRLSKEGEKVTTLDGITRNLPQGTIVIQDSQKLIDLCGIMGGANSRVSARTKRVVIFVQSYDPLRIRKTTQTLTFRTDAATRFEKGIDLEGIVPALSRAVLLAKKTAGAKIASELIDIYKQKPKPKKIRLTLDKLNRYLGINLNPQKAAKILSDLGFKTSLFLNHLEAEPPSWRNQDIEDDVDLIEEIARIYGYHHLPQKLPEGQIPQTKESELKAVIELKKALKYLGLTEIISYSIISKDLLNLSKTPAAKIVELSNPLTDNWQYMRTTILPSLLKVISENQNLKSSINLFEIAKTYIAQKKELPTQDLILSIILQKTDFYEVKGVIENIFDVLRQVPKWHILQKNNPLFRKSQSAEIKIGDKFVGLAGIVNFEITDYLDIKDQIAAAEINLTKIYQLPTTSYQYKPIPKYPPIIEDISAIFATAAPVAEIVEVIKKASELIKTVEVVDIFKDEKIGENKKSVSLRLTYQKSVATPSQEEVNTEKAKIISSLEKEFRANVRK